MLNKPYCTAILTAATALLMACATTNDPHKGGFIDGIYNLSTGRYEQRIAVREEELERQQREHKELIGRAEALRQERERIRKELEKATLQVARLDESIKNLRAGLSDETRQKAIDQARLQEIESAISKVRAELEQAKQDNNPIEEQSDHTENIKKRIARLHVLVNEITGEGI